MSKRIWDIRQSAERPEEVDIYIYGDVESDYYDWWTGNKVVSETSANFFRQKLGEYPNVNRINLYINSYGGSVYEGIAIYTQLRRHPAEKVGYCDGFACSIASVILAACDKVIMGKNTLQMVHFPWLVALGNSRELRKTADDLDVIGESTLQSYLEKGKEKLQEEIMRDLMDKETWLSAERCIELGLADEYAEDRQAIGEPALAAAKYTQMKKDFAARLQSTANIPQQKAEPSDPVAPDPEPVTEPATEPIDPQQGTEEKPFLLFSPDSKPKAAENTPFKFFSAQ